MNVLLELLANKAISMASERNLRITNPQNLAIHMHDSWDWRKFFFRYQIIRGTGKAIIFHKFIMEIIKAAQKHYENEKFLLIFDNAATHTALSVRELLTKVPHVYIPPYRPEFNGIEHLFSWMKRKLVQNQPIIYLQFGYSIHWALNQITASNINFWCESIYSPMVPELNYLQQSQSE